MATRNLYNSRKKMKCQGEMPRCVQPCTGCRSCEIACRNAHEETMGAEQWGIHVHEEGPWKLTEKKWEWEYLPFP